MGSKIAVLLITFALIVGGYFVVTNDSGETASPSATANTPSGESLTTTTGSNPTNTTPSNYVNYSSTAIADATADGGRALLFFHADWCPTCRAAENDILRNSSDLPKDLTIIKTDYDTMRDLKKKYRITYQHTFVQVDANGEMITKWGGGGVKTINQNLEEV